MKNFEVGISSKKIWSQKFRRKNSGAKNSWKKILKLNVREKKSSNAKIREKKFLKPAICEKENSEPKICKKNSLETISKANNLWEKKSGAKNS